MEVGERHLGGRDQEQIVRRHRVQVVLELRQLAGAGERRAVDEIGRRDLLVAVLAGVEVEHEAAQRAHQPRAQRRAAAGSPSRRSWRRPAGRECRAPRRAPSAAAARSRTWAARPRCGRRGWRDASPSGVSSAGKVGQRERALVELGLDLAQPRVERLDLVARLALRRAIRSSAGSLARFRRATSSLAALRSALSVSACTSSSRRWRSSSRIASSSGPTDGSRRRSSEARLPSGSWRRRLRSITALSFPGGRGGGP